MREKGRHRQVSTDSERAEKLGRLRESLQSLTKKNRRSECLRWVEDDVFIGDSETLEVLTALLRHVAVRAGWECASHEAAIPEDSHVGGVALLEKLG